MITNDLATNGPNGPNAERSKTGFVVFAHGSTVESANQAVRAVVADMARAGSFELTETAFLEGGKPGLLTAIESLMERGAGRICVVPYFLTTGMHLKRDLPALIDECRSKHPSLEVVVSGPLDGHPALARILLDRANAALQMS